MPFPRTWTEEIVAEWLHLDGYLVETSKPLVVTHAGGRHEADVIGAKVVRHASKPVLEIVHVEVGLLAGGQKSIPSVVKRKFSPSVKGAVRRYFLEKFGFKGKVSYRGIYVATWAPKLGGDEFMKLGIEMVELYDFLVKMTLPTIERWKRHTARELKAKGKSAMLPGSHWLLQLLDYLNGCGEFRGQGRNCEKRGRANEGRRV